ncbi:MAG TPA: hypothetical protein VGE66_00245 [Chitinophagaceae bacterium]
MKQLFLFLSVCVVTGGLLGWNSEATPTLKAKTLTASPAPKQATSVPIRGEFTTSAQVLSGPPLVQQRITGYGQSSHLGKSSFVALTTLNLTTPPPFSLEGTAVFTAANGDEFYTTFSGTATPNGAGANEVEMVHTITGGTGRFSGATGSFSGYTVAVPGHTQGTITHEGTINY